ncbi:MAG TPA: hypothetical protein DHW82_06710 [Spirochaetia bacterium]|nr:MAG: hypothetical protein A2Y41_11105 [Spirochaetes bacterium GWB1_36_13]HCL56685.1 hypothetical protein [Spirochaetia bacterium]
MILNFPESLGGEMFKFLKIAFRNIFRHKRRTFFTAAAIVIGLSMLLTARGFLNGFQKEMIQGSAELLTGEIQIHSKEYAESLEIMPMDKVITPSKDFGNELKKILDITAYTYRTRIAGVISRGQDVSGASDIKESDLLGDADVELNQKITEEDIKKETSTKKKNSFPVSSQFIAVGVDPLNELKVCPRIKNALVEGRFFTEEDNYPENTYETVGLLNAQLMKGLSLNVGDTVVLMPWDVSVKIVGKLKIDLPTLDKKLVYLPLKAVQNMLYERNYAENTESVHEIVIKTKNINEKDKALEELKILFSDKKWAIQGWEDFLGFFSDVRKLQNTVFWMVLFIILLIVSTSIINTGLMSVMERTREIGTLMAIGYKRKHIISLFLLENLSIGMMGGLFGIILGSLIVTLINRIGIHFTIPGTTTAFIIRPDLNLFFIGVAFLFGLLSTLFAAIYPSYHASRLKPVDALSNN